MANSDSSVDQASPAIVCGTLTATGTGVNGYTPALPDKPCRAIFLAAPQSFTPGAITNTSPVLFGDATVQNDWIKNDGTRDRYVQVDNASKINLKFGTIGDKLEYRIET